MNSYLKVYSCDAEAYAELADLYLSVCETKKAAYCLEELILSNPHHFIYHLKYAEVLYTIGDYQTSRKYYAQCLLLNKECVRAMYGMLMVRKKSSAYKTN